MESVEWQRTNNNNNNFAYQRFNKQANHNNNSPAQLSIWKFHFHLNHPVAACFNIYYIKQLNFLFVVMITSTVDG